LPTSSVDNAHAVICVRLLKSGTGGHYPISGRNRLKKRGLISAGDGRGS
jgi:hypothetical protein